eukprot:TRINITY_DN8454_c0_g1_i4.p1 TRINITY_DN8454_c0_g1~~TRINITY_DN8454_c0_g1_i4.p1  ORF type:complete len:163 (+),score=39.65 TRINITY_DN8454_c0_g1_i4:162-650(+)
MIAFSNLADTALNCRYRTTEQSVIRLHERLRLLPEFTVSAEELCDVCQSHDVDSELLQLIASIGRFDAAQLIDWRDFLVVFATLACEELFKTARFLFAVFGDISNRVSVDEISARLVTLVSLETGAVPEFWQRTLEALRDCADGGGLVTTAALQQAMAQVAR